MRVLVTVNCYGVDASAAGGIALARMMNELGHTVLLQAAPGGPVEKTAGEQGLDVSGLCLQKSAIVTGLLPFKKLVKKFVPDVICTTRADGQTACALAASDIPLVRIRCDIRKPRTGRLWRIIDSRTDLVVFPSRFMVERGYAGEREGAITVISHPVDTEMFSTVKHMETLPRQLISIGRLSPMKGHRTLIRALALLPEDVCATIIGPPSQQSPEELLAFAGDLGVRNRLNLPGRIDNIREILSNGGIGVVTSLGSEVVSRAGMEIMSTGLPLLAAATNGLLDLVNDGETGLFHSPGNHRQLAAQAGFLLDNPDMALRMGRRARNTCVSGFSYPVIGKIWEKALQTLSGKEHLSDLRVP
ncbi:MAG: glycosyltransferase family 4 protein [Candidatus Aegiribacteria sp.]|nr:glycosyltransferase family 4 protein [Candidatus Aegiribacteria sp.]